MKTQMRWAAILGVAAAVWTAGQLQAASTDSIQLLVTPGVTYSVTITSADANVAYNFGSVDLGYTTRTERAASVTNTGNVVSEYMVAAYVDAPWTLGTATGTDVAVLKALFNSAGGAIPSNVHYNTLNGSSLTTTQKAAENSSLSTTNAIMTNIAPGAVRSLNFMLHMPSESSAGTQRTFTVYVNAVAP